MYNKKLLLNVLKDLNKAKKPTKKKDINYDATGKGMLNKNYAGKPVRLATDTLYNPTPYRINAKSDNGIEQTLEPYDETNVNFPGANYIDEYPEMKKGGGFSRNLLATNRLFKKNTLFKKNPLIKPNKLFKKKNYKRKIYDPQAMYFQDGGETLCLDDGRCLETDQIQEIYDKADRLPLAVANFEWDLTDELWTDPKTGQYRPYIQPGKPGMDARELWKRHGIKNFVDPSCMYVAGLGYRCAPATKDYLQKFNPVNFNSNSAFISAVDKGDVPFVRTGKFSDPSFDKPEKSNLQVGDIVNFKGADNSHAMTFMGYSPDGESRWFDSNGMPSHIGIHKIWEDLRPNNINKGRDYAYVNRFDSQRYVDEVYGDKIKELEEKARTNPTYIETELTKEDIDKYVKGGYVVEEINDPSIAKLNQFVKGGSPCDDGYTYDPKLGCIPMSEENMTEDQKWMVNWYKNRRIDFPEDQASFRKVVEKTLPAYNPNSPMFEQMHSFPVYETMPKEYMQEDIGGFPAAGMYDTSGKVPKIYFNPDLTPEQKSDTERHELTNYLMEPVKDKLYPMYNKIVEENIIPFDESWPKEKQDFYDYVVDPQEQNIQSYLNVARKKFNLKPDEVVTPERLNKMKEDAEKKGMLDIDNKNFNQDIYLLFKMAKDEEGLLKWFNLIAKNENKEDVQYAKQGGQLNQFAPGGTPCPRGQVRDASGKCVPYNWGTGNVQAADSYTGMYTPVDSSGTQNLSEYVVPAKKGKSFSDWIFRGGRTRAEDARKKGKDAGQYFGMPGESLEPVNYTKAGLDKFTKDVKNAQKGYEAEEKNRKEYEKAQKKMQAGKISTDKFAREYDEKGWAEYDPATMKEGYKGQFQDAVDEANARKEANMGVTTTALELLGGGAGYRVLTDPLGTAKGVAQTVGDIATLPVGLGEGIYNYATNGNFDMGVNPLTGVNYGEGVSETFDALGVIPGIGAASKLAKFTKATDLAGDAGKFLTTKTPLKNTYKLLGKDSKFFNPGEVPHWRKGYQEVWDPEIADLNQLDEFNKSSALKNTPKEIKAQYETINQDFGAKIKAVNTAADEARASGNIEEAIRLAKENFSLKTEKELAQKALLDNYENSIISSTTPFQSQIGKGSFGKVYDLKNSNKVVKIGRVPSNENLEELVKRGQDLKDRSNIAITTRQHRLPSGDYVTVMNKVDDPGSVASRIETGGPKPTRESYEQLVQDITDLQDRGLYVDFQNTDNIVFNPKTGKFNIYDLNTTGHYMSRRITPEMGYSLKRDPLFKGVEYADPEGISVPKLLKDHSLLPEDFKKGGALQRFITGGEEDCPEGYMKSFNGECVPRPISEQANDEEWYRNWYANRVIQDEEGQKLLNEARPKILKRAEKFPETTWYSEPGSSIHGSFEPLTGELRLNSASLDSNPFLKNEVKFHEKGHYLTSPNMMDPEVDTVEEVVAHPIQHLRNYEADVVDQALKSRKDVPREDRDFYDYLKGVGDSKPYTEEISKNLMQLRRLAGFKPDQVITEEDINNLYKKADEKGWTDPNSKFFVEPFLNLINYTKDTEQLKTLFNKLAKNEPEQVDEFQPQIAQYGGGLDKFVSGGIPCPPGQKYNTKTGKCEYIFADHAPLNMLRDEKRKQIERLDKFGNLTPILDDILPGSSYNPKYIQNLKEFAITETPQWKKDRDKFGKDKIAFYESLFNPKKWGLNDYSDYSSYNSAFRNARESGEKEFVYKGKRYNTNLVPKEESDLYWESKDFLKKYYEDQDYKDFYNPSNYDKSKINDKYIKEKYGNTWSELHNKQKKLEEKLGEKVYENAEYKNLDVLMNSILNEEASIRALENKDFDSWYNNNIVSEDRKLRTQKLDKPTYFSITTQKPKDMEEEGYWNEKRNKMFLKAGSKPGTLNTTYIHELSHKGDEWMDAYDNIPKVNIELANTNPRIKNWTQEFFDYVNDPTEVESRKLSTLFYLHKNKKPWKAGKITLDALNELYDNIEDLPFDIQQLLQIYGEQKIDLLNYLNSKYNYENKKEGGAVNYELGDEIDEATMNELKKLGYTFEEL